MRPTVKWTVSSLALVAVLAAPATALAKEHHGAQKNQEMKIDAGFSFQGQLQQELNMLDQLSSDQQQQILTLQQQITAEKTVLSTDQQNEKTAVGALATSLKGLNAQLKAAKKAGDTTDLNNAAVQAKAVLSTLQSSVQAAAQPPAATSTAYSSDSKIARLQKQLAKLQFEDTYVRAVSAASATATTGLNPVTSNLQAALQTYVLAHPAATATSGGATGTGTSNS